MEQQIGWILWLAGTVVLINFIIYVLTGIEAFRRALRKESGVLAQVVLAVLFGGFAVLSTYLGPRLASGAIVNVRDSWPMAAGLAGGP